MVTDGTATLDGEDLLGMEPEERAAAGLFLAFQYPVEIPGVGNMTFLRTALNAQRKARGEDEVSATDFLKLIREKARQLDIDAEMLKRPVNVGFSGGEKKRNEILQMAVLEPRMCILDETDSGLDVDAHAAGGGRGQRAARRRAGRSSSSPTTSGCSTTSRPTSCTSWPTAASSRPAAPSSRSRSRRTATATSWPRSRDGAAQGRHRRDRGADRRPSLPPAGPAWAGAARREALARLRATGLPQRRDEYWRFTRPDSLNTPEATPARPLRHGEAELFDGIDRLRIVFVDGRFDAEASDDLAGEGIEIARLAGSGDLHWARELYGTLEARGPDPRRPPARDAEHRLRHRRRADPRHGRVSRPVALVYLHEDEASDAILHHVVRVEPGADLTLLEAGPAAARFNNVLEVEVGDDAGFHHVRAQGRDHERRAMTHIFARLGTRSTFKSFTLTVNGVLTRNECVVELTGDDAMAHVAGAAVGDGDFHHDDTVFVTHDALRCESRQVFKKVLRNGATGVFQGKILVKPGAQQTDGYQISQALLLDGDSQFLAKPELEIYADDVKCSHGSTSGAIDDEALFYLRSRGVGARRCAGPADPRLPGRGDRRDRRPERSPTTLVRQLEGWLGRRRR